MLAAVEHSRRAVWGVGRTATAALADARHWMQIKSRIKVGTLEIAELSADADLTKDGETLYQWVKQEKPVQDALF